MRDLLIPSSFCTRKEKRLKPGQSRDLPSSCSRKGPEEHPLLGAELPSFSHSARLSSLSCCTSTHHRGHISELGAGRQVLSVFSLRKHHLDWCVLPKPVLCSGPEQLVTPCTKISSNPNLPNASVTLSYYTPSFRPSLLNPCDHF